MDIEIQIFQKQWDALVFLDDNITNEVLYWGWARWWKSFLWCLWVIKQCISKVESKFLIGRNELKRLRSTTLLTFFEVIKLLKIWEWAYNYNAQDSIITFINWSKVFLVDLSYIPSDPNYDRLWSYWLTWIFIDEAQEIDIKAINILKGRLSVLSSPYDSQSTWKTIPKMLYTCNPSLWWVKNDFYSLYKDWILPKNKQFISSLATDNPHISKEYIEFLATADKITVERLLKWNFDYDDTPWKLYSYDDLNNLFRTDKTDKTDTFNNFRCITCDVARFWRDKAIILVWEWFIVIAHKVFDKCSITELQDEILRLANIYHITKNYIIADEDGVGGWLTDSLQCKWFVNNSTPIDTRTQQQIYQNAPKPNYENLKTQCYFTLQHYIQTMDLSHLIEYKQDIIQELDIISERNIDKDWKKQIIRKEDVKKAIGRSPDFSDCICFRMFFVLTMQNEAIDVVPEFTESDNYIRQMLRDNGDVWILNWIL